MRIITFLFGLFLTVSAFGQTIPPIVRNYFDTNSAPTNQASALSMLGLNTNLYQAGSANLSNWSQLSTNVIPNTNAFINTNQVVGTNIFYVATYGNNSTAVQGDPFHPYLTINAADTAAKAMRTGGSTNILVIQLYPGWYALGTNSIWPTNNVVIRGDSPESTIITATGNEHTNGPPIMAATNLVIENLSILCQQPTAWGGASTSNLDQTCIGALSDTINSTYGGTTTVRNCILFAGAHGIQLNSSGTAPRINIYNSTITTSNCPVQTVAANCTIGVYDCETFNIGPEPRVRLFSCGFQNPGGTLIVRNTTAHVTGFATATQVFGVVSGGLTGSPMTGAATNLFDNVVFDVRAGGSSGTIVDVFTQPATQSAVTIMNGCRRYDGTALVITTNASGTFYTGTNFQTEIDVTTLRAGSEILTNFPTWPVATSNTAWMGPTSGSAAAPTQRALVAADLPSTMAPQVNGINITNLSTTNLSGNLLSNNFKYQTVNNKTFVNISNTVTESMLMDTNNLVGGWNGGLQIPTNFWVAGAGIRIRIAGYMTSTGSANGTAILRLTPAGVAFASGMSIGTTGSVTANSQTLGFNEITAYLTYDGTNVRCVGDWLTHNVNDRLFTSLNTAYTITNTVSYQLSPTFTFGTAASTGFFVVVYAEVTPVGP